MKSGKIIEGEIIEESKDYIKVRSDDRELYYEHKFIEDIQKSSGNYLKNGLEYAADGKFSEAEKEFLKGISSGDTDQNLSGALDVLDSLKKGTITKDFAMYLFKGSYYLQNQDYAPAAAYLEKALELSPDDLDILYNLGVCYYSLHNYPRAITCLEKSLTNRPDDAQGYGLLGNAYYSSGDSKKAEEKFSYARQLYLKEGDYASVREIGKLINEINPYPPIKE